MGENLWILITGLLVPFCFHLIYERLERISLWLVRQQCRLLPSHVRDEREREWASVVREVDGNTWKLITAFGLLAVTVPGGYRKLVAVASSARPNSNQIIDELYKRVKTTISIYSNMITKIDRRLYYAHRIAFFVGIIIGLLTFALRFIL
jgi:hypothetical protein